jgi:hypothetical protein
MDASYANRVCQSAEPVQPFRMLLLGRHCIYNIYMYIYCIHLYIHSIHIVCMHACMYGWMDACIDVWMYGRMDVRICIYIYIDVPQFLSGQKDVAAYKLQLFFTPEDQVSSLFSHFACLDSWNCCLLLIFANNYLLQHAQHVSTMLEQQLSKVPRS